MYHHSTISPALRALITFTIMCVSIMELIDMTIINIALPDMMGALGANVNEITWIITSYIVASSVFMPLTGILSTSLGVKKLLLFTITGFGTASFLCGISQDLHTILFFRFIQGACGAVFVPISQVVLRMIYPKEQQGKAMAIWGIGIMVAPILGPTIGGYITQYLSWRWTFFVNIPACAISLFLTFNLFENLPGRKIAVDWYGLVLMCIWVISLQLFLDRGNQYGWLGSLQIIILLEVFILSFTFFIIRGLYTKEKNIINLHLFKDRNFSVSCLLMTLFGIAMFGGIVPAILLIQTVLGYPVIAAGELSAPQGLASALTMFTVGALSQKLNNRLVVFVGIFLAGFGSYLKTYYNLSIGIEWLIIPQMITGIGMGCFFVPLATIAYQTLAHKDVSEASGIYSFCRNVGNSAGVAITSTMLSHTIHVNIQQLSSNVSATNPNIALWMQQHGITHFGPEVIALIYKELARQAQMIGFLDVFYFIAWAFFILLPLVFLISSKKSKR